MNRRWVAVSEVAERLGISRPTATAKLGSGEIPGRICRCGIFRVEREVFEKWLESQRSANSGKSIKLTT